MEENHDPADQTALAAPEAEKPNDIARLEQKNRELLAEKKKIAEKAAEHEARLKAIEQEKLESQGKYQDINKTLKEQLSQEKASKEEIKKAFARKTLTSVVQSKARELGAEYPDAVLKLMDKSQIELIGIDDDFNVDSDSVTMALEDLKKTYPSLFRSGSVKVKDVTPTNGMIPKDDKPKTEEEIMQAYCKKFE
jgi:chromosome segregation ATPase